jgi:hypothetical protein
MIDVFGTHYHGYSYRKVYEVFDEKQEVVGHTFDARDAKEMIDAYRKGKPRPTAEKKGGIRMSNVNKTIDLFAELMLSKHISIPGKIVLVLYTFFFVHGFAMFIFTALEGKTNLIYAVEVALGITGLRWGV